MTIAASGIYTTAIETGLNTSVRAVASPAKVLQDIMAKQLSGRVTIRDPNDHSVFWRVYVGNGQVHFATSAVGQQERLAYLLQRYSPHLNPMELKELPSDYQYLCHHWQSGQLPLPQVRKLLFALTQEALAQFFTLPRTLIQFERTIGIDPLLLSVPLKQTVLSLRTLLTQWADLRPEVSSPFQRPIVRDREQFYNHLSLRTRDAQLIKSLSEALNQGLCIYEVAYWLKMDVLKLAVLLQKLVRVGVVGVQPYNSLKSEEKPVVACIDDSKAVQRNVKLTLEAAGYQVLELLEPARALTTLARVKPSLVLMDITMPEIDGYELCRMLRQSTLLKEIPIVMLTGRDGIVDRIRARMVGAVDYVVKPFEPQQLLNLVQRLTSDAELGKDG